MGRNGRDAGHGGRSVIIHVTNEGEARGFKPSEKEEEEYILRQEWDRRKKAEQEKQNRLAKEERERLKKLHHMKCCKCGMEMISLEFKGITVDRFSDRPRI